MSDRRNAQTPTAPMFNRVLVQRETIISLKLYNSFNVTKKSSSDAQDRVENIKTSENVLKMFLNIFI